MLSSGNRWHEISNVMRVVSPCRTYNTAFAKSADPAYAAQVQAQQAQAHAQQMQMAQAQHAQQEQQVGTF
jgi:hypothetical protein